jgi:formate hydrogenlyase subunit 6/NADH:ubiquinone oxidoreductase subunit I
MGNYFLAEKDLKTFVQNLIAKSKVIAPVAKRKRFDFAELTNADDLRLDYDTTILPPKRAFFPPKQDLVCFDGGKYKSCVDAKEQILFGVHPHDLKAISMTDKLYAEKNPDCNYLNNRKMTTIVALTVQNLYKNAFFGSVCHDYPIEGYDLWMTKINGGYFIETGSAKGEKLLSSGTFSPASGAMAQEAEANKRKMNDNCPEKLNHNSDAIRNKMRSSFNAKEIWEQLSEDCFSCGSCNIVCPTCYCFDVQDEWGLGAADGIRYRRWDACLTGEFSEVSVQGGSENFREEKHERYRHRFMRKTAYLNDKLGAPACVGCGRCSGACTANIANPVNTINKIMEN